jgi:beta-lactamase superfamily II metal-dependent hydrolase
MRAHFLDVGQGAATVVEFPCGAILIDAGGAETSDGNRLVQFLGAFFATRTDLGETLAAVFVTHTHIDHNRFLQRVVENFTVLRYIDNGRANGSGSAPRAWLLANAAARNIAVVEVDDATVAAAAATGGLTSTDIDPLDCSAAGNPTIYILSGGHAQRPSGWSQSAYNNGNNHSLVIRVDWGKSAVLFTGDLEQRGIQHLLARYPTSASGSSRLDVDGYVTGHHGSDNGTTAALIRAMSPRFAAINVGRCFDGAPSLASGFTTFSYRHPRAVVVNDLAAAISRARTPLTVLAGTSSTEMQANPIRFTSVALTKSVFATGWDGRLRATLTQDDGISIWRWPRMTASEYQQAAAVCTELAPYP